MDTGTHSSPSISALRPCSSRATPKSVFVDDEGVAEDRLDVEHEITSSHIPKSVDLANCLEGKGSTDGLPIGKAKGGIFKRRKGNGGSSSAHFSYSGGKRGLLLTKRRKETNLGTGCCGDCDFDELALPLGISLAAFIAQVVELKNVESERIPVEHLSKTCISAMKESVPNIYQKKFDNFLKNFEKSFGSTLKTLRVISKASSGNIVDGIGDRKPMRSFPMSSHFETQSSCQGDSEAQSLPEASEIQSSQGDVMMLHDGKLTVPPFTCCIETPSTLEYLETQLPQRNETSNTEIEEIQSNHQSYNPGNSQIVLSHEKQACQQLVNISQRRDRSRSSESILTAIDKLASEQAHFNMLKGIEIDLTQKKMQLKQSQLHLTSHSNFLEKVKISMGVSKARFKEEKLKNQMQDFRHAELVKKCIDYLVAGLLIMSVCLGYGTWVYSYKRITEATLSCNSYTEVAKSWWVPKPMATFNSTLQMLRCHVVALSRMSFGLLLILAIAYSLFQRSASPVMPVTFILLVLGVICGFAGKLCIDTLGGSGYWWLIHWEVICLLHFCVNAFPSVIHYHLYGPVLMEGVKSDVRFPHRIRRFMFCNILVLILPVCSGFIPFAPLNDWIRHFIDLVYHPRKD